MYDNLFYIELISKHKLTIASMHAALLFYFRIMRNELENQQQASQEYIYPSINVLYD